MNSVSACLVSLYQSLVLISKLPYVTFFHSLLKIMAPEYFEKQEPCLEAGQSDYLSVFTRLHVAVCKTTHAQATL